ncbi:MAG: hypothetical protein WC719_02460 [Patescibacteria group bacterium]|jgi:hypothetical protein
MNRRIIKLLVILVLLLFLLVLGFYSFSYFKAQKLVNSQAANEAVMMPAGANASTEIMTEAEKKALGLNLRVSFEVVSRDNDGRVASYKSVGAIAAQPVGLEWMADADKIRRRMATSTRVQVLERDNAGEITAFKIIQSDADIVQAY